VALISGFRRFRFPPRSCAGAAAVSAVLDFYLSAGAHWFVLLSAPAAEPFYAGFGFVAVDHAPAWIVEGT